MRLGGGSSGSVYKAPFDPTVAIKKFKPNTREEFSTEVKCLELLSDHTNIVQIYGHILNANHGYIALPCAKMDIETYLKGNASLDIDLYTMAHGIFSAGACMARAKIAHFDLKSENILLMEDCRPSIADFSQAIEFKKMTGQIPVRKFSSILHNRPPEDDCPASYLDRYDVWMMGVCLTLIMVRIRDGAKGVESFRKTLAINPRDQSVGGCSFFLKDIKHPHGILRREVIELFGRQRDRFAHDGERVDIEIVNAIEESLAIDPRKRPTAEQLKTRIENARTRG